MSRPMLSRVRLMIPPLKPEFHKGQAGRVAVIGGSEEYTGAPFFSCTSAMSLGADMGYIIYWEIAETDASSGNVIVHPKMRLSHHAKAEETAVKLSNEIKSIIERMHAIVVGPGLGRDKLMQDTAAKVIEYARSKDIPFVLDGDALWLINQQPDLVKGYTNAILTPNVVEFKRLCDVMKIDNKPGSKDTCAELAAAFGGVTIVQKGSTDIISNGKDSTECSIEGGLKRAAGQGDTLSGTMGTFLAWKVCYQQGLWDHRESNFSDIELSTLAAYGACAITRWCSHEAFRVHGRAMQASHVVDQVGKAYKALFEDDQKL